jgi:hypothetical protein
MVRERVAFLFDEVPGFEINIGERNPGVSR